MKNPKINRVIGYIVLFIGFGLFYKGLHASIDESGIDYFFVVTGLVFVIASIIWMILKVRCPHCGGILNPKLTNIDCCPYCGKNTEI